MAIIIISGEYEAARIEVEAFPEPKAVTWNLDHFDVATGEDIPVVPVIPEEI